MVIFFQVGQGHRAVRGSSDSSDVFYGFSEPCNHRVERASLTGAVPTKSLKDECRVIGESENEITSKDRSNDVLGSTNWV